jgi:hypothetical protein
LEIRAVLDSRKRKATTTSATCVPAGHFVGIFSKDPQSCYARQAECFTITKTYCTHIFTVPIAVAGSVKHSACAEQASNKNPYDSTLFYTS